MPAEDRCKKPPRGKTPLCESEAGSPGPRKRGRLHCFKRRDAPILIYFTCNKNAVGKLAFVRDTISYGPSYSPCRTKESTGMQLLTTTQRTHRFTCEWDNVSVLFRTSFDLELKINGFSAKTFF